MVQSVSLDWNTTAYTKFGTGQKQTGCWSLDNSGVGGDWQSPCFDEIRGQEGWLS